MFRVDNNLLVNKTQLAGETREKSGSATVKGGQSEDFGTTVSGFLNAVNEKQQEAATQVMDVVQGNSENLHEAMTSLEEARLSFQLLLEVRNRLMESYQEIQRMQV